MDWNPRPPALKVDALPTELSGLLKFRIVLKEFQLTAPEHRLTLVVGLSAIFQKLSKILK